MRGRDGSHRRRFLAGLAATGSAALAGCGASTLPWTDAETTFTAADAADVLAAENEPPEIERPAPVTPTALTTDMIEDGLERVDTLLTDVPNPIENSAVPHATARRSIVDRRDEARDSRDEAAAATGDGRYYALRTICEARDAARTATTTLDAATAAGTDTETVAANLREERDEVYPDARDRFESIAYRGDDTDGGLLRAALFRAQQERDLRRAVDQLDRRRWSSDDDLTPSPDLGDDAGALEFATATGTVWTHLEERFDERTAGTTDLTAAFEAAVEPTAELVETIPHYTDDDWPDGVVDGTLDDEYLRGVLWGAVEPIWDPNNNLEGAIRQGDLGIAVYETVRFEVRYRAFERVRGRINDGTLAAPESVDEIRAERTAAVEAATAASEFLTRPSIGRDVLAQTLRSLAEVDDYVRQEADSDPETEVNLRDNCNDYVCLRAQFEELLGAVETVRERLRSA